MFSQLGAPPFVPQSQQIRENTSTENRKLFIGGLSYDTNDASLEAYFGQFGEISNVSVLRDSLNVSFFFLLIHLCVVTMQINVENLVFCVFSLQPPPPLLFLLGGNDEKHSSSSIFLKKTYEKFYLA